MTACGFVSESVFDELVIVQTFTDARCRGATPPLEFSISEVTSLPALVSSSEEGSTSGPCSLLDFLDAAVPRALASLGPPVRGVAGAAGGGGTRSYSLRTMTPVSVKRMAGNGFELSWVSHTGVYDALLDKGYV